MYIHVFLARHCPQQCTCINDRAERVRQKQHSTTEAGEWPNTSNTPHGEGNGRTTIATALKQSNPAQRQEQMRHAPPQRHTPKWRACTEGQRKHQALAYIVRHYSAQRHPGHPSQEAHRKCQASREETHPPTKPQQAYNNTPTAWHGSHQHPGHYMGRQPCPDRKANGSEPGWQTTQQGNSKVTRQWPGQQRPQSKNDARKAAHGCNPAWRKQSHLAAAQRPGKGKAPRERRRSKTAEGSHTKTGRQTAWGATSEADSRRTHPARTQNKGDHAACNKHSAAMPQIDNKQSPKVQQCKPKVKVPS